LFQLRIETGVQVKDTKAIKITFAYGCGNIYGENLIKYLVDLANLTCKKIGRGGLVVNSLAL
jgi:hypothetical protein